jgi:hypothetical protein
VSSPQRPRIETVAVALGTVVASRTLADAGAPDRKIKLAIGMPRRVSRREWRCPVRIDGLEARSIKDSASGIDAIQALLLSVECIRWHLEQSGRKFAWLGNSQLMGSGLPKYVPIGFGGEFERRVERAIQREAKRTRKYRSRILRDLFIESTSGKKKLVRQHAMVSPPSKPKAARRKKSRHR